MRCLSACLTCGGSTVLTLDELLEHIAARYDEVTILEALEINAEDLVERFCDRVKENRWKFEEIENEY